MVEKLQQELLQFLLFLTGLNPAQIKSLCEFIDKPDAASKITSVELQNLLLQLTPEQLDMVVERSLQSQTLEGESGDLNSLATQIGVSPQLLVLIEPLFKLFQLQDLLLKLSVAQIMKIFEVIPPQSPRIQQLQILQQLQQILATFPSENVSLIHQELTECQDGFEQQTISRILQLQFDQFHLYQPLRYLFQMEVDEVLRLHETLPSLHQTQTVHLLQLLQIHVIDVLELRRLLTGEDFDAEPPEEDIGSALITANPTFEDNNVTTNILGLAKPPPPPSGLRLKMVEQPPEQCIYRRNVKPNPTVMLGGDETQNDGNLYVVPSVIRCDEMKEEPKFLTGGNAIQISAGRVVSFRKLKIMVTSHQQQETLFILKFELRRYQGPPAIDNYEVLYVLHSNPICVLSHSTQLKPASSTIPVISEIVPARGVGGTRVAILGSNFTDTPQLRVKFDDIDVVPVFHGPGTLICHIPQHAAGTVGVKACNDPRRWSESSGVFHFEEALAYDDTARSSIGLAKKFGLDIAGSIAEVAWEGNFEKQIALGMEGVSSYNIVS